MQEVASSLGAKLESAMEAQTWQEKAKNLTAALEEKSAGQSAADAMAQQLGAQLEEMAAELDQVACVSPMLDLAAA